MQFLPLATAAPVLAAVRPAFSEFVVALLRRFRSAGQSASLLPRSTRLQLAIRSLGIPLLAACWACFLAAQHARAAAGDADTPALTFTSANGVDAPSVLAVAVQPDGKIIIGGTFVTVNGLARPYLARLNADGTLDLSWDPGTTGLVSCVAVEADGRVLIGGGFSSVKPVGSAGFSSRNHLARLNADGTLDSFNPDPSGGTSGTQPIWALAVQPDGKFLVGGDFGLFLSAGVVRNGLARFNRDGTIDTSFVPANVGPIRSIVVQADGKILRGGDTGYGRLNANGTADTTFATGLGSPVYALAVQADGKVILGGNFNRHLIRANTDGSADSGFLPRPDLSVNALALQADGNIILGGDFGGIAPNFNAPNGTVTRNRVARLQTSGALDPFDPSPTARDAFLKINAVALQADGKALISGDFNQLQPNGAPFSIARPYFARLLNDAAAQTLAVVSASQVLWTRGGAAPELNYATFELSTDGGTNWAALPGTATRVGTTPNWQLTGLSLPAAGHLRARGRVQGGWQTGSSSLIEQVIFFSFPPEIAVSGNGVNIADGASAPSAANHTDFGPAVPGATTVVRTFTITNLGMQALNLTGTPRVAVSGPQASEFAVTQQPTSPVAANNGTTTFQVTFTPGNPGVRNATLSIASNDADEAIFDFAISGRGLSYTTDSDGDGMSDAAEFQLRALGFDWTDGSPAQQQLVATYYAGANGAGLYTAAQVQALSVNTPLIQRNPATGQFTLVLGLRKSTDLQTFTPFPFNGGNVSINGSGQLEFSFSTGDNAAFFRLQSP